MSDARTCIHGLVESVPCQECDEMDHNRRDEEIEDLKRDMQYWVRRAEAAENARSELNDELVALQEAFVKRNTEFAAAEKRVGEKDNAIRCAMNRFELKGQEGVKAILRRALDRADDGGGG